MDKESKAYKSGEFPEFFHESELTLLAAEEAVAYNQSQQKYFDNLAAVDYASRSSFEKGREEGLLAGREEGLLEGREEERMALAKRLREEGMSCEFIFKVTGISL